MSVPINISHYQYKLSVPLNLAYSAAVFIYACLKKLPDWGECMICFHRFPGFPWHLCFWPLYQYQWANILIFRFRKYIKGAKSSHDWIPSTHILFCMWVSRNLLLKLVINLITRFLCISVGSFGQSCFLNISKFRSLDFHVSI